MTMPEASVFTERARHLGKSARTKARLIDAAITVFARDGLETASVNEVAREAGLANGTFYLHFKDKDELTSVVAFKVATEIAREMDEAMTGMEDAAERVSRGTREFIRIASERRAWGWSFVRAYWTLNELRRGVGQYLRADLERGVQQGAFTVEVDDFLVAAVGTMVISALFAYMSGDIGPEVGSRTAELQLRMVGVSPARARRIAWRPL